MNRETRILWLKRIGYPVFFLFAFFFLLAFQLPGESIKRTVELRLSKALARPVTIGTLSTSFPLGVDITDVSIGRSQDHVEFATTQDETAGTASAKAPAIIIEKASIDLRVLPLLWGSKGVNFAADIWGGTIEGTYSQGSDLYFDLSAEDLLLKRLTFLKEFVPLPMSGEANMDVNITLPGGDLSKSEGQIHLLFRNVSVGDGKTQIQGFTVDPIKVGKIEGSLKVEQGVATISEMGAKGSDLEFSIEGKMHMSSTLLLSRLDNYIQFRFAEDFQKKNEKIAALLSAMEQFSGKLKRAKRVDGFYGFRITGMLGTGPRFIPSRVFHVRQEGEPIQDREPASRRRPISNLPRRMNRASEEGEQAPSIAGEATPPGSPPLEAPAAEPPSAPAAEPPSPPAAEPPSGPDASAGRKSAGSAKM